MILSANRIHFFLLSVMIGMSVASCHVQKKLVTIDKVHTRNEILFALSNHNIDPQWFAAKGDIELNAADHISGTFDVRLRKDSIMIVSARKLGVEGARIQISPTDYTILYRLEGLYQREPISSLRKYTGFDVLFDDIQAMILGNVILPDTSNSSIDYGIEEYKVFNQTNELSIQYWIKKSDVKISKVIYTDKNNHILQIDFANYQSIQNIAIPHNRTIVVSNGHEQSTIIIEIESIEMNIPKKMNFHIPVHYEKL